MSPHVSIQLLVDPQQEYFRAAGIAIAVIIY